jgi:hypothetical protein
LATPDVPADVVARLAALLPDDYIVGDNLFAQPEEEINGAIVQEATFVVVGSAQSDPYSGGPGIQWRRLGVQVLHRFERLNQAAGLRRAWRIYDALHLSGPFVGATDGARYIDVRAVEAPAYLSPSYYAVPLTVWLDG